jgi:hypothetical protein
VQPCRFGQQGEGTSEYWMKGRMSHNKGGFFTAVLDANWTNVKDEVKDGPETTTNVHIIDYISSFIESRLIMILAGALTHDCPSA